MTQGRLRVGLIVARTRLCTEADHMLELRIRERVLFFNAECFEHASLGH